MSPNDRRPKAGDTVVLTSLPGGLIDGLPSKDQNAISEIVGKPVVLNEYDELGRAELQFRDKENNIHFVWVNPDYIKSSKSI